MRSSLIEQLIRAVLAQPAEIMIAAQIDLHAGRSPDAVRRLLASLHKEGSVRVVGRKRQGQSRPWNLYALVVEMRA